MSLEKVTSETHLEGKSKKLMCRTIKAKKKKKTNGYYLFIVDTA